MARRNRIFSPHAQNNRNNRQNTTKAPYTFIPVVTGQDDMPPVFGAIPHNGQPDLLSGELRCELEALTPLFVGHFQYPIADRTDVNGNGETRALNQQWGAGLANTNAVKQNKHFREPLFLGNDPATAPVVIPGASLKGMLRHNIGALTSAPMERVQEQYFSYRPNMSLSNNGNYLPKVAYIEKINDDGTIDIQVLQGDMRQVIFRQNDLQRHIDYDEYTYHGGVDNGTRLNTTPNGTTITYRKAWIPTNANFRNAIISKDVAGQYMLTQEELADLDFGHISRRNDIDKDEKQTSSEAIKNMKNIRENQLIYVEMFKNSVLSFGHNFRYRWRYSDSILKKNRLQPSEEERPEIASPKNEHMDETGGTLTGARLLFGYVDGADDSSSRGDGSRALGIVDDKDSDAARLAGRISINAALEVLESGESLPDRFITRNGAGNMNEGDRHRYTIPLKILGAPKASAVEHYIRQPDQTMKTYGDLPGENGDKSAGDLSGRKFYRHQKNAATKSALYQDTGANNIETDQSGFAQFISLPGRKFRFTLRFKDLRDWELGLVLLALDPHLHEQGHGCANKLGHGRPLGLGSVQITIDELHLLGDQGALQLEGNGSGKYVKAFLDQAEACNLTESIATWLKVLDYEHSSEAAYPNADGHIYTYHTNIRGKYSAKRRNEGGNMRKNYGEPVKP